MVGVEGEPAGQFGVARPIVAGEVALGQDMADEAVVAEPADDQFGLAILADPLKIEDLAVAVGIGEAEGLGQYH